MHFFSGQERLCGRARASALFGAVHCLSAPPAEDPVTWLSARALDVLECGEVAVIVEGDDEGDLFDPAVLCGLVAEVHRRKLVTFAAPRLLLQKSVSLPASVEPRPCPAPGAERRTLGVAVPCYRGHLEALRRLLDNLELQTVPPDAVAVSCSSTEPADLPPFPRYSFSIVLATISGPRNSAENRNRAAALLDTDAVSFIDADDLMHPRRLEAIARAMEEGADLVLHDFAADLDLDGIVDPRAEHGCLERAPSGCAVHRERCQAGIHHGMVSVRRRLALAQPFPEDVRYLDRSDALFCGRLLELGVTAAYLPAALASYTPSCTCLTNEFGTGRDDLL